jgi:CspA family cold shock protein
MNGKIKKLVRDKGYGFITGDDKKDYFFHRTALSDAVFDLLEEGVQVEFEAVKGKEGKTRAENVICI